MGVPPPPWWISGARAIVSRLPRGRYAVVSRLRPRAEPFAARLADDIGGAAFVCDLGDAIAREVCLTGYYEPPVTRVMQRLLAPGGTLVDAGANWGYFTLVGARLVGAGGRVVAIEPDPRHFERLRTNTAMNRLANVTALPLAAGSQEGVAMLTGYAEAADNRGVSRIADGASGAHRYAVRCATIDALTSESRRVDVVKIDVEGAEPDVLAGMREGLASGRYRAIVLELHPELLRARGVDPAECIGTLTARGYRGWTIDLSPEAYRAAAATGTPLERLLRSLDEWRATEWPHLLWLAPGESVSSC